MPAVPLSSLANLRVRNFRCIPDAELDFHGTLNVFTGANGAGKTSFLEAIFFLGRGRSFRAPDHRVLIGSGGPVAEISGQIRSDGSGTYLGVRIAPGGLGVHVGGEGGFGPADLAAQFPVQAIDAEISSLGQGPPEPRRRLLDWGVFHVKHEYLPAWRAYRRALAQRNAALREQAADAVLAAWEKELAIAGEAMDSLRAGYLADLAPAFRDVGQQVLGADVALTYAPGWDRERSLAAALESSRAADRVAGFTRVGPQRADLRFEIDSERSRWRASKGQQKLLGAALILAQARLAAVRAGRRVVLVIDEPAADLDSDRLAAFLTAVRGAQAQIFLASIDIRDLPLGGDGTLFHVEHGCAKALL